MTLSQISEEQRKAYIIKATSDTIKKLQEWRFFKEVAIDGGHKIDLFGSWDGKFEPLQTISVTDTGMITVRRDRHSPQCNYIPCALLSVGLGGGVFNTLRLRASELFAESFKAQGWSVPAGHGQYFGEMQPVQNGKDIEIATRIAIHAAYHHRIDKMKRIIAGSLWRLMNREVATLTLKVCGGKCDSLDYTLILRNFEEVKDTFNKAPGVLAVWRSWCRELVWECMTPRWQNCGTEFSRLMMLAAAEDVRGKTRDYTQLDLRFPNIIQETQARLQDKRLDTPLSPAGWRFLVNLRSNMVRRFCITGRPTDCESFNTVLHFFADVGLMRYTILKGLLLDIEMAHPNFRESFHSPDYKAIVRAAHNFTKKAKRGVKDFWTREMSLVMDWYRGTGINLDKNQRVAPWSWFMRQQAQWHATAQQRKQEEMENKRWESLLTNSEIHGYMVVPLMNGLDLFDDGKVMHHCVASYADRCVGGHCRIFSIRKGDERVATCEIGLPRHRPTISMNDPHPVRSWELVQVRGKCNAEVPDDIKEVARTIARSYNGLQEIQSEERIRETA